MNTSQMTKPFPEITIREGWCKGCCFCVESCPKQVLRMDGGKAVAAEPEKCTACLTCVRICPYDAPVVNPELVGAGGIAGAAEIAPAACRGCGICAGECPAKAIQLQHYRDEQVLAKMEALFAEKVTV